MKKDFSQKFNVESIWAYLLVTAKRSNLFVVPREQIEYQEDYLYYFLRNEQAIEQQAGKFLKTKNLVIASLRELATVNHISYSFIDDKTPGSIFRTSIYHATIELTKEGSQSHELVTADHLLGLLAANNEGNSLAEQMLRQLRYQFARDSYVKTHNFAKTVSLLQANRAYYEASILPAFGISGDSTWIKHQALGPDKMLSFLRLTMKFIS